MTSFFDDSMNQHTSLTKLEIDLRQMVLAIEDAVSLVGMNDTNHGKRVGYIACQLADELDFEEWQKQYVFDLGLLHDCGVSTHQMHASLVNYFDWSDSYIHCEIGFNLLKDFEPLAHFAVPILYHHTKWEDLQALDIDKNDAMMANLIFLADRIDVLAASHYGNDILVARENVANTIVNYGEKFFNPLFLQAFEKLKGSEAFWIALENRHITRYTWDMGQMSSNIPLTIAQLKQLSLIMAYVVDQKSPFTAQHSARVANLAKYLSKEFNLSEEQCDKIEIAGLLHDLGKLRTPDYILEKQGGLTALERSIMNQHSFETYEIIRHIKGLEEIACWAAFHHEGLNGGGYPFHRNAKDLSLEARIIAVSDIFQALVQDRPYRVGMELEQVMSILNSLVAEGRIDGQVVEFVKERKNHCFDIASGSTIEMPKNMYPLMNMKEKFND
jgi:putative nucleotidyltransferase with HDIG domain